MFNQQQLQAIRQKFPFFSRQSADNPLTYLDNAATTQKPATVIRCINDLWEGGCANVHRSSHSLANHLTEQFENARETCRKFVGAAKTSEIIWTTGTTESINLVAHSWGSRNVGEGNEILITAMEHHANILPWQQLCDRSGAQLKVIPITESAEIDLSVLRSSLNPKVKLLAICHVSNVLGTINPIKRIVQLCHQQAIKVLVDGAQAAAHLPIDVQDLDCDFYAFSGHKCFAPEATGVLYAKETCLQTMPAWKTGGEMVKSVDYHTAVFQQHPLKFEAGTPNISGIIAFAKAMTFISELNRELIRIHEQHLLSLLESNLLNIKELEMHSKATSRLAIFAFSIKTCNSMDIAMLLDEQNIAIRSGQLCAMPLVTTLNKKGILRVSFSLYNSSAEVLIFVKALKQAVALLSD